MSPASVASDAVPAAAHQRLLELAAYLRKHQIAHEPVTLERATSQIPSYAEGSADAEALRKKFRRDLAELEEQFGIVATYDEADRTYRVEDPFFTTDERHALIAAATSVAVDDQEPRDLTELGGAVDDQGALVFLRVHRLVRDLRAAIEAQRTVTFTHASKVRTLEPYALGYWRDRWYIHGADCDAEARRTFRLDRVDGAVTTLDATFDVPDDFDPATAFLYDADRWGTAPPVTAVVEVDADYATRLADVLAGEVVSGDGATARVEADVHNYPVFRDRVLAFGAHARVLEPPVLVDLIVDWLRPMGAG